MILITLLLYLFQIAHSQYVYPCSVPNCLSCTYPNFCGICEEFYLLDISLTTMNPVCKQITCMISQCQLCYYTNQCQACIQNQIVTPRGSCQQYGSAFQCPANCISCNLGNFGINSFCIRCISGYVPLTNGSCVRTYSKVPQNCLSALYPQICQICQPNYAVTPNFGCTPFYNSTCDLNNCLYCNSNGTCQVCQNGYEISFNDSSNDCLPIPCQSSIPHCAVCSNSSVCTQCQFGYVPTTDGSSCLYQAFACTIANCIVCGFHSNQCSICQKGYFPITNSTTQFVECVTPSQLPTSNTLPTNCAQYASLSQIIQSVSSSIVCVKCNPNFFMVGGQCLLLINQNQYSCNVPNCQQCIFNDYCGLCREGYRILPNSGGLCAKLYSPAPNCLLSSTQFTPDSPCLICQTGYLNYGGNCFAYNTNIACNISGCSYCVSNNSCAVCLNGYVSETVLSTNLTFCAPICQITNCFLCASSLTCSVCNYGYVLNTVADLCTQPSPPFDCTTVFGLQCLTCNSNQCTNCKNGFSVVNGQCCQNAVQNIHGCLAYSNQCSSQCIQCFPGFILAHFQTDSISLNSECISFACSIPNCQYCFRTKNCIVCSVGYVLNSSTGQCTNNSQFINCSTVSNPFCTKCSNSSAVCTACMDGYTLMNNGCYCSIPNCLQCMGSAFCYKCASPFVPSPTSGQCVPSPSYLSACQVQYCSECNGPSKCSFCAAGYSLTSNNQCVKNNCPPSMNCLLCDASQLICYECAYGFTHNQLIGAQCESVPQQYNCNVTECALCSFSNPNVCLQCVEFFEVDPRTGQRERIKCIAHCQLCISSLTCITCNIGFYLNSSYICQPNDSSHPIVEDNCSIPFCLMCSWSSSLAQTCQICQPGYELSNNECTIGNCQIDNCKICRQFSSHTINFCLVCQQGFYLDSYLSCIPINPISSLNQQCSIYNCMYCAYNDTCSQCASQMFINNGICVSYTLCSAANCVLCAEPWVCLQCQPQYYVNSQSTCSANCSIPNCNVCLTPTACATCSTNYTVSAAGVCVCGPNFILVNGSCVCPTNANYSYSSSGCVLCNISYCLSCTVPNKCSYCINNLIYLGHQQCGCSNTAILVNEMCVCPDTSNNNYTVVYNQTCTLCNIQYCQTCNKPNICQSCSYGFQLINTTTCTCPPPLSIQFIGNNVPMCQCSNNGTLYNGSCVPCNIFGCTQCMAPNANCSTCQSNMKPSSPSGELCYLCSIVNCVYCSLMNYCSQCAIKFGRQMVPNGAGQSCIFCSIPNCSICQSSSVCAKCSTGLQVAFNSSTVCVNCSGLLGCLKCNVNQICAICLQGYTLTLGQCIPCVYPCKKCIPGSINLCQTCQFPFIQVADGSGHCYNCEDPNCLECPSRNTSACQLCRPGYQLDNDFSGCYPLCLQKCTRCTSSGICMSCMVGYVLYNGLCVMCDSAPACQSCLLGSLSTCLICGNGFYLSYNFTCNQCSQNCLLCTPFTCKRYRTQTKQLIVYYNGNTLPFVCDPACLQCSSGVPSKCVECLDGYYFLFANSTCLPCPLNCKTCLPSNSSFCLSCYSNSFLSNGQCLECIPSSNCLLCSNNNLTQCIVCPYGYSLTANGICEAVCPANCLACTNSTFCHLCQEGYSRNSVGQCLPCLSACKYCPQDHNYACLDCGPGFYLSDGQECVRCSANCLECSSLGCQACMVGYMISSQFTCIPICHLPCATCSPSNPSQCTSCLAGYKLGTNSSVCVPIMSCSGGCNVCPFGTIILANGTCFQCNIPNCARCSSQNLSQCGICNHGFYLNSSSLCSPCPTGCDTCSSSENCFSCSPGYTSPIQPITNDKIICLQCAYPCLTCYKNVYVCQSCVSGFAFQGWKCVSTFNFGFNVSLSANLTYFQMQYGSFLAQISNALQSNNTNIVTINSISQSDNYVNIFGNTSLSSSPDSQQSSQIYNSLEDILMPGSLLANMQIASSNIFVNGGSIDLDKSNLPLILGISISVGIIIILAIVIGICIYVKKRKSSNTLANLTGYQTNNTNNRQSAPIELEDTNRIIKYQLNENSML